MNKGLFFGLNTIDLQFLIEQEVEPNQKYKAKKNGVYTGGPATNAAVAYAYLGGEPILVTPVGKHAFTSFITEDLKNHGVQLLDPLETMVTQPIFASVITSSKTGNRTIFSYKPEDIPHIKLNGEVKELIHSNFLLLDGFYMDQAIALAKIARENSVPVILDAGSWKEHMETLLPYVDVCIASSDFFPPDCKKTAQVMEYLYQSGIKKIAITRGEKSILYRENATLGEIHAPGINVVDTLGAGDFFHGAYCFFMNHESTFISALIKAAQVASNSCKHFGTREWMKVKEEEENVPK